MENNSINLQSKCHNAQVLMCDDLDENPHYGEYFCIICLEWCEVIPRDKNNEGVKKFIENYSKKLKSRKA